MNNVTKSWEPLYHKGKQGETRIWKIWTEENVIKTEYGVLNGQLILSEKKCFGKSTGKKNATTDSEQAEKEAQSLWVFKKERKYSETIANAQEPLVLPMLAKEFNPKNAIYPAYIQPKLDGVRCLAFWDGDKIKLISRGGKEWTVCTHIAESLKGILPKDGMFDGELYIHGKSCQTVVSYVKKLRPETLKIQYHIYDMPIVDGKDDLNNEERLEKLKSIFDTLGGCSILLVTTNEVSNEGEVKLFEKEMINKGYEGAILRNKDSLYLFGYRSKDLMKIKTFKDAEFVVIDVVDGIGKFEGKAIFICRNDTNDLTFECTMATSMATKAEQFQNKTTYIGKKLTVKFFDRTDLGIPRFPVGKVFRPTEDLD